MGIFWSHEFIGTEWDFKHFNFNRDTLPRHFWRFSELPKVGLPNDEWIRRQDSVIATSGSTGGSSLRGLAAERDRLQRQAPEWRWGILRHDKMCCFFFLPQKKDLSWCVFWRMSHCHVTMFLFVIFFFFLGSGFAFWDLEILFDGSDVRYKRCAQMSPMLDRKRDFGKWIPMKRSPRSRFLMFWSQTFTGVVSKIANHLHLRQVITKRQTSI